MRKNLVPTFLLLSVLSLCMIFCSCIVKNEQNGSEATVSSVSVVDSTVPTDAVRGEVDVTLIQIEVKYSDGKTQKITMDPSMLTEESTRLLDRVGTHLFTIVYQNKTAKFQMAIHDKDVTYYSLRIYGGVPTFVNGKKLDNVPVLNGDYYENVYPDGTVVTVQWIDDGNNFSYWTANDLQVGTESIIDVVVDGNLVYRPYSAASVSTVSFKTYCSSVLQSITTNVLYEKDIPAIYRENYIFYGWTTDNISEAEALSGYAHSIVSFPYEIGRNVTFYASWIPMGVVYTLCGSGADAHYEVTGYEGSASTLDIPSKYNGLDVTVVHADAFSGKNAEKLKSISLPASLTTVEAGAFKNCTHLAELKVTGSGRYRSEEGVLITSDGRELVAYPANKVCAEYVVPGSVETVDAYAFYNAVVGAVKLSSATSRLGLKCFDSVHIDHVDFSSVNPVGFISENTVFNQKIDKVLFSANNFGSFRSFPVISAVGAKAVSSVDSVNDVYAYAYEEGDGQTVTLLYRVVSDKNLLDDTDAGNYDTAEILGLYREATTFAIPIRLAQSGGEAYYVTSFADNAMKDCTSLSNVVISFSSRLARVGDDAFIDTPWLKNRNSDVIQANDIVFKYLGSSETFVMGTNIKKIAEGAFKNNKTLKYVNIGTNASLETIGAYAFANCSSFRGFICEANPLGEGVYLKYMTEKIGEYAFYGTAVTALKLQTSTPQQLNLLTSVGEYAFGNCKYLKDVTISASTRLIASTAFTGCVSLCGFIMDEIVANPRFEVYEGILYGRDGEKNYSLFAYPAGRLDGEFDPSYVRTYGYGLEYDLSGYMGSSDVDVGSVYFNGVKKDLYLIVCTTEEWETHYDTQTETYSLRFADGKLLKPSSEVRQLRDGSFIADGDYYFSVDISGMGPTPLLYDEVKDAFYYYPVVRYYADDLNVTSSLYDTFDESSSLGSDVGEFSVQGRNYRVYLKVKEGILIRSGRDNVPLNETTGQKLKQTTSVYYNEDGTFDESDVNGEFYFYFYYSDISSKKTVLLYDPDKGSYYFTGHLNVTSIGENAFSYSSVAAVNISPLIRSIGQNAFDVPGLMYLKFNSNPASFFFDEITGDYKPKNVYMSDKVAFSDKELFFGAAYRDRMDEIIATDSYEFFFADEDRSILYAVGSEDNNLYVVRASRVDEQIVIPEIVYSEGVSMAQVKKVLPYAFYGVYLRGVVVRGVDSLASHAFSEAHNLTRLYVETDFINDVQTDTFGETFHNGMYIYDSQNGLNLYKGSNWVPAGTLFTYRDQYGAEQSYCPYLILNDDKKPFAVITYVDDVGETKTVGILYGNVTTTNVSSIQETIARTGYDISGWEDGDGNIIDSNVDYDIPYNQVLSCVWSAQTYTVYFVVTEGEVKKVVDGGEIALPAKRNETTGIVTYQSTVTYDEEYFFVLSGFDRRRTVFSCWKDNDDTRYGSSSQALIWDTVVDGRVIYLYPVTEARTYKLKYVVGGDVTVESTEKYLTFGATEYYLDVPTTTGYSFAGWYFVNENGNKVVLTNERGRSRIAWDYSDKDEYEVYALWNTVLVYPEGDEVSLNYGDTYKLTVPSAETFDGWYIRMNGVDVRITDEHGDGIGTWTFDGKEEYDLFYRMDE